MALAGSHHAECRIFRFHNFYLFRVPLLFRGEGRNFLSGGSRGFLYLIEIDFRLLSPRGGFLLADFFQGGGEKDVVLVPGFLRSAREGFAARVLPAFAGVVPMETTV